MAKMSKDERTAQYGGLGTSQLALMRMLMSQQKAPTIQFQPVQDWSQGLSAGVSDILNAVNYNRQNKQQQTFMDQALAQEQASQQAEQAAMAESARQGGIAAQQLGVPIEQWNAAPDAAKSDLMKRYQDEQAANTMAQNLQQQAGGLFNNSGMQANGRIEPNQVQFNPNHLSDNEAWVMAHSPDAMKAYGGAVGNHNAWNQFGQGQNVDTTAGSNAVQGTLGLKPTNNLDFANQYNQVGMGRTQLGVANQLAPYQLPQLLGQMGATQASTLNSMVGAQGGAIDNQWKPVQNQIGLNLGQNTLDNSELERQKFTAGLQAFGQWDGKPETLPAAAAQYAAATGQGNPFQIQVQTGNTLFTPGKTGGGKSDYSTPASHFPALAPVPVPQAPQVPAARTGFAPAPKTVQARANSGMLTQADREREKALRKKYGN